MGNLKVNPIKTTIYKSASGKIIKANIISDAQKTSMTLKNTPFLAASATAALAMMASVVSPKDIDKKLKSYAVDLLENKVKLKEGQPLVVSADKTQVPFLGILAEEAYKRGASEFVVKMREPELEKLKAQYLPDKDFDYKKKKDDYYKEKGAAYLDFNEKNPYMEAGLNHTQIRAIKDRNKVSIPEKTQKKLAAALNPQEITDTILNLQKGQPLRIVAEREHEPNVLKIVEYAYKKGAGPIEVSYTEPGNPIGKARLKYAREEYLKEVPSYISDMWHERVDKKEAALFLDGEDPELMSDIDPKRMIMSSKAISSVVSPIRNSAPESQWNILYAPTTMSVRSAYPDIEDNMKALDIAAGDAKKINRSGHLKEHALQLSSVAQKVNDLHLDEIHFYSVDPITKKPDGKTDLKVGLTQSAIFRAAEEETDDGVVFIANTPTEEVFSSPDKTRTNGWVSATLPLSLNGNLVEGIRVRFENGKAVEVYADKNQELWREHIKSADGADMLGEVALVAGSPIFDTGRVFNSTLLDENATCHIAIGRGFDECCDGAKDIENYDDRKKYLADHNVNYSDIHTDFMIGGPNVVVEGKTKDGKIITLIKDNAFQI